MQTQKIYIYGAGGHGRSVADVARAVGYTEICFLDDFAGEPFYADLPRADIIIAVGDNIARERLYQNVRSAGFPIVNLIHPKAIVSPAAELGNGVVVMAGAVVNVGSKIGDGVIVNTAAVIDHDCHIEAFAHISPKAALAGHVRVGTRAQVGIGSCMIQHTQIGSDSIIGAGSVVVRNIPSNVVAFGNPCRVVRQLSLAS